MEKYIIIGLAVLVVILLIIAGFAIASLIASRKNWYPLICAGIPTVINMLVIFSSKKLVKLLKTFEK